MSQGFRVSGKAGIDLMVEYYVRKPFDKLWFIELQYSSLGHS